MSEKFAATQVHLIELKCKTCAHWSKKVPGRCLAYPDGIPLPILLGEVEHTVPYAGDGGIRYKKAV